MNPCSWIELFVLFVFDSWKKEKRLRRSISFRDRSVEKVGRRKQGHWHWPQPARERVSLLPSFFFPPGGCLPPLPFPFPPPLFLLHHRHPLLYLLYVCSLRCDRDSKRRIGLVIFAPAAEEGRGGGDGPVRALIRDERVMSLTNKPSRYERFFWIAWRSMSWFLLSPRFDAAPSFPRVLLSLSLSRRSTRLLRPFNFLQFCHVCFIRYLFMRYTSVYAGRICFFFNLEILSLILYIRYPMYYEGYICF